MHVSEDILHFIWRFRLFRQLLLLTSKGQSLRILQPGILNEDAGPDFHQALLLLDGVYIYGHIEIHVAAKDWRLHGHSNNPVYNTVVLHVVWDGDEPCFLEDGSEIPTLRLCELIEDKVLWNANRLLQNINPIPCSYDFDNVPAHIQYQVLQRTLVERFESRYVQVLAYLKETKGDWERVSMVLIAAAFGMKVNKLAFIELGMLLDINLLKKFANKPTIIQALFFGQAGFLTCGLEHDPYVQSLQNEYQYFAKLYQLPQMSIYQWKFMRMRPANFPSFKLSQLAALFAYNRSWFAWLCTTESLAEIRNTIARIEVPEFWMHHYHFKKETVAHNTAISDDFFNLLVINSFSLILFAYGKYVGDSSLVQRALDWLEQVPVESNRIVAIYRKLGFSMQSAMDSQAVLQLQKEYCERKRCLHCGIGASIVKGI